MFNNTNIAHIAHRKHQNGINKLLNAKLAQQVVQFMTVKARPVIQNVREPILEVYIFCRRLFNVRFNAQEELQIGILQQLVVLKRVQQHFRN